MKLPLRPLALGAGLLASSAFALQPLDQFVRSSANFSPDNAESRANLEAQRAQHELSIGRALPGLTARGTYTRNQYQVGIPGSFLDTFTGKTPPGSPPSGDTKTIYLQRYNQLDAFFTLNVPLIDIASFERISAASTSTDAAEQQARATYLNVEAAVVQGYYQLVADQALAAAADQALSVAKTNLQLTQTRFETGKAAALDVDRARAEVERQSQQLTSAQLQIELAARALESASGMTPDISSQALFEDDLHVEAELAQFEREKDGVPQVVAAAKSREAAEQQARAQKLTLIPNLSGSVTEHGTNAASFTGQPWSYTAGVNLNWGIDVTTFANIRLQDAQAWAARAREERAQLQVRDAIHRAWATVASSIARSRSARAEQVASTHASKLAQDRYEAGAATQLDLLQAQRDAFSADVSRIQADADLANARLQLRFAAGQDPFAVKGK